MNVDKTASREHLKSSHLPHVASPPWRQLVNWIIDPIGFQDRCRRKYGDIFTLHLGGLGAYVMVGNPQAIGEIFSQDSKFDAGRGNALAEPLVGRNSLMLMDGNRHHRERKLLMPPFHGERLDTYAQKICQITQQVALEWQVDKPFVARTQMQQISLEVILQVVFGLSEGERYQQLKPLLTAWLDMTDSPLPSSFLFFRFLQRDWGAWSPWGQMKRRQQRVHDLLQAEIEERRSAQNATENQPQGTDVLTLLMTARDEAGQAMTDEELTDELLTILFAGHETTATLLAWALYQIHRQVAVRETLIQELDSFKNASPIDIAKLPYLTAVCQETLRMYPVLPMLFVRVAKSPVQIAGYSFNAETRFMASIYLVHHQENLYPNAQQFKPERFLGRQYSLSEYFPFGGGSRRCLGSALAQLEMKLVIATILSRYQLALAEDKPVEVQRRGFTLAPKSGVPMVVTGKRS